MTGCKNTVMDTAGLKSYKGEIPVNKKNFN